MVRSEKCGYGKGLTLPKSTEEFSKGNEVERERKRDKIKVRQGRDHEY
jgi:hypothetical protein